MIAERAPETHKTFLDYYVHGVATFDEYLHRCGGLERLRTLRAREFLLDVGR